MRTISVVLVDDSPEIRQLLVPHLETTAVDVVGEAADGEAALELVRRLAPDVVVMDVHLPGVDGIQAMRESSACHPQAIVVAFTDSDETGVEEAICQAGAVRHFHKDHLKDLVAYLAGTALAQAVHDRRRRQLPVVTIVVDVPDAAPEAFATVSGGW